MRLPVNGAARSRIVALALGGVALLLAFAPAATIGDAQGEIARSQDRLDRLRAAAFRPPGPAPLLAIDEAVLLALVRDRLAAGAADLAVAIDQVGSEADPASPNLVRVVGSLRGSQEGLTRLMTRLEDGAPALVAERFDLTLELAADDATERPATLRLQAAWRGHLQAGATP